MDQSEHVILVDEQNNIIGTTPKATVHGKVTPLHRAFSAFIFRSDGKFLIQQRALSKVTWPGIWSNSVCGHPLPEENLADAVRRRLQFELGLDFTTEIFEILPKFRYRASFQGVEENEICPVWIGFTDQIPEPNPAEVETVDWIDWNEFSQKICDPKDRTCDQFSPWCQEETALLIESKLFQKLYKKFTEEKNEPFVKKSLCDLD